jgi:YgiT-type zinc finger domain-containing protein
MRCSIDGCPGEYEEKLIVHTVRSQGKVVVIDHVPAEVCSICSDVLLGPDTIRKLEEILKSSKEPSDQVPLYEFA